MSKEQKKTSNTARSTWAERSPRQDRNFLNRIFINPVITRHFTQILSQTNPETDEQIEQILQQAESNALEEHHRLANLQTNTRQEQPYIDIANLPLSNAVIVIPPVSLANAPMNPVATLEIMDSDSESSDSLSYSP